jgi:hypothetical protein
LGRPKGPDLLVIGVSLSDSTIERLRQARKLETAWTMNKIINLALDDWLKELEAQEDLFTTPEGYEIRKPAGLPYPKRISDGLRQGPPREGERGQEPEREGGRWRKTTARLEAPIFERLANAVFWRETLRGRDTDTAIRAWPDKRGL